MCLAAILLLLALVRPNRAEDEQDTLDLNPDWASSQPATDGKLSPPPGYCSLCRNGRQHIACQNSGNYAAACTASARVLSFTPALATSIVTRHNVLRNQIARGALNRYRPATRMATMRWDNELAKLAALNVKQCAMQHDQCRATIQFPYAGQNLAVTWWTGPLKNITVVALQQIQSWFVEHQSAAMKQINSFRPVGNGQQIGHFTQIVQEKATHVGCAILRELKSAAVYQFMACNYAYTNVLDRPVYTAGLYGGSQCTTGRHERYKYLCSALEPYNVTSLN